MFDLQQGLARKSVSRSCIRTWKADFDFWGEQRTKIYDKYGDSNSVRVGDDGHLAAEFQYGDESDDHNNYGPSSPRLWTSRSPLLPRNRHHHHSYPTPTSRLQAIIDGRRELMEMIQDLPESSYELSLKDIVDEQATDQMGGGAEGASLNCQPDQGIKPKQKGNKKKINVYCKKRQISRSQSMDSGVFLLKMFFPVPLGLKKSKTCNCLKVSPSPSMKGLEKTVDREWWKVSFLAIRKSLSSGSRSSAGSGSSRSSSRRSRQDDSDFAPGCWSFNKKSRSKGQSGCLL